MTVTLTVNTGGVAVQPMTTTSLADVEARIAASADSVEAQLDSYSEIKSDVTVQRFSENDPNGAEKLGFDSQGKAHFSPSQNVAKQVGALLPGLGGHYPTSDITFWGDSMTAGAGAGGSPNDVATLTATALGRTTYNRGIGGQDSKQIAFRSGAWDLTVNISGNSIPTSGGVAITSKNRNILYENGVNTGTVHVEIQGVPGIISTDASANWTFTRDYEGVNTTPTSADEPAVLSSVGTSFIADPEARRSDISVFWMGRNGGWSTRAERVEARDHIVSMVENLSPYNKRFLVISVFNGRRIHTDIDDTKNEGIGDERYEQIMLLNAELERTFGPNFIDVRSYMVNHALEDYGYTPTATDLLDIAADCIPTQIMADSYHPNDYEPVADFIARTITARGW